MDPILERMHVGQAELGFLSNILHGVVSAGHLIAVATSAGHSCPRLVVLPDNGKETAQT